jgi:hypothetical protein
MSCGDHDPVNHPDHYTAHPSGIECIEVTRWMNFNCGNAVKYLWRNGLKPSDGASDIDAAIQDLRKAIWYINDEIDRLLEIQQEKMVELLGEFGEHDAVECSLEKGTVFEIPKVEIAPLPRAWAVDNVTGESIYRPLSSEEHKRLRDETYTKAGLTD